MGRVGQSFPVSPSADGAVFSTTHHSTRWSGQKNIFHINVSWIYFLHYDINYIIWLWFWGGNWFWNWLRL